MVGLALAVVTLRLCAACGSDPQGPPTVIHGDVDVRTQADLQALLGVGTIEGSLTIEPSPFERLDLSPLHDLQTVGVFFSIQGVAGLHDLEALAALQRVGRNLIITHNPSLRSLHGLENLAAVDRLTIAHNDSLQSLTALTQLGAVQEIWIQDNASLSSLHGLDGMRILGDPHLSSGEVIIARNPRLQSLAGLDGLRSVGLLTIIGNDSLSDLSALASLEQITRLLNIRDSHRLRFERPAFARLTTCEELQLLGVAGPADLRIFAGTRFDEIVIGNTDLVSLSGLAPHDSLHHLELFSNSRFVDITALAGLKQVGRLGLGTNPALTSLEPLSGCQATDVVIQDCDQLTSLHGLEGITSLVYGLRLIDNDRLTSLAGLQNLTLIGRDALITNNVALCDTLIEAWAQHVTVGGAYMAAGNLVCH